MQVREAAVEALIALLAPGRLTFSRPYFLTLEEVVVQLVRDGSESVARAAVEQLLPALQVRVHGCTCVRVCVCVCVCVCVLLYTHTEREGTLA